MGKITTNFGNNIAAFNPFTYNPLTYHPGFRIPSSLVRYVPKWLRAPKISQSEIDAIQKRVGNSFMKLPQNFEAKEDLFNHYIWQRDEQNLPVIFEDKTHFNDAVGYNNGTSIHILEPDIVAPWARASYKRAQKGVIAHEDAHTRQIVDDALISKFPSGMDKPNYQPTISYYPPDFKEPIVNTRPLTKKLQTTTKKQYSYGPNKNAENYDLWKGRTYLWFGSPNELNSEWHNLTELGYVGADGYPNKLGMKFLSQRFHAPENQIKEGLDALVRNFEYHPYTVTEELNAVPFTDLLSFYGDKVGVPVGIGIAQGIGLSAAYDKMQKKNDKKE